MRQLIFVFSAALAIGLAAPARADVTTGERAYLAADYRTAVNELMPLAQQGDAQAQYLVGVMYAHGKAIERNFAEAESWYARAATQGHELAAFNLGFMYYNGAGEGENAVAQSYAKAVPWLGVAAAGGDAMAQALLGTMYYQGLGVERDSAIGAAMILKAAEQGVASAQYTAAVMLATGDGIGPDLIEAYAWFAVLADSGYPGAADNRDIVAAGLTPEQFADAQQRVQVVPRPRGVAAGIDG